MFDTVFYILLDYHILTKNWAYIFMGITVVTMVGFWMFLAGKDED